MAVLNELFFFSRRFSWGQNIGRYYVGEVA
jgi:hypothetical protein